MTAEISKLNLFGFSIRKGSYVNLDFHGDGNPLSVKVERIYSEDGFVTIESSSRNYCLLNFHHSAEQYEESGVLVKF